MTAKTKKRLTLHEPRSQQQHDDALRELRASPLRVSDAWRPTTRSDCEPGGRNAERPCPYVGCSMHLYLDSTPGVPSFTLNFPDLDAEQLGLLHETCALDVAARKGQKLEEVGVALHVTREAVRLIEARALRKLKRTLQLAGVDLSLDEWERPIPAFEPPGYDGPENDAAPRRPKIPRLIEPGPEPRPRRGPDPADDLSPGPECSEPATGLLDASADQDG